MLSLIILIKIFLSVYFCNGNVIDERDYMEKIFPDIGLTTPEMIARQGYPMEVQKVTTKDGYILELHRIPRPQSPVVFIMHGLLCSSAIWVELGPQNSLAYLLYDNGYDVWMGNARGNRYSKKHIIYTTMSNDPWFWDFSWHEMGIYDLPAVIDHILLTTGQSQLNYIGHSMGTTMFWVLTSQRPEYNAKIRQMHALAPVAYMTESSSNVFSVIKYFKQHFTNQLTSPGILEILPGSSIIDMLGQLNCRDGAAKQTTCETFYFLFFGKDSGQLNKTALPIIISHTPAGTSTKTVGHFIQQVNTGKFSMFDYGNPLMNLVKYRSSSPPEYDLSKISAPVYFHVALNDSLTSVQDITILSKRLPNLQKFIILESQNFNHMDFLWGLNAKHLIYDRIIGTLKNGVSYFNQSKNENYIYV